MAFSLVVLSALIGLVLASIAAAQGTGANSTANTTATPTSSSSTATPTSTAISSSNSTATPISATPISATPTSPPISNSTSPNSTASTLNATITPSATINEPNRTSNASGTASYVEMTMAMTNSPMFSSIVTSVVTPVIFSASTIVIPESANFATMTPSSSLVQLIPTSSPPLTPTPTSSPFDFPPPGNLTLVEKGLTTFSVKWTEPPTDQLGGYDVLSYMVEYFNVRNMTSHAGNSPTLNFTGRNLDPATKYEVRVKAVYNKTGENQKESDFSTNITFTTDSNDPPTNVSAFNITQTSFAVSWTDPVLQQLHSPITNYSVCYNVTTCSQTNGQVSNYMVENLRPFTQYSVSIATGTIYGFGAPSMPINVTTKIGAPSTPLFSVTASGPSSIIVTWMMPSVVNGPLDRLHYQIKLWNSSGFIKSNESYPVNVNKTTLFGLSPNTKYVVVMKAFNIDEDDVRQFSEPSNKEVTTEVDEPIQPNAPKVNEVNEESAVLTLPSPDDRNGPIGRYEIWVATGNATLPNSSSSSRPPTYDEADLPKAAYVAAIYVSEQPPSSFVLGNNSTNTSFNGTIYRNAPLMRGVEYRVIVRVFTKTPPGQSQLYKDSDPSEPIILLRMVDTPPAATKSPPSPTPTDEASPSASPSLTPTPTETDKAEKSGTPAGAIAAAVVVTVVLVVAIVAVMLVLMKKNQVGPLWKKRSQASKRTNGSATSRRLPPPLGLTTANMHAIGAIPLDEILPPTPTGSTPTMRGVSLDEFPDHVAEMHMHSDIGFSEEYDRIRNEEKRYATVASALPANEAKNRYGNVNAYDHSRFRLTPVEEVDGSDYINANYIDGYGGEREYVAAQGPVPVTVNDFWRMIWEANTRIVVMVTNLKERGRVKCDQYWPDDGQAQYGDVYVEAKDTADLSTYVVRTFKAKQLGEESDAACVRTIKQYHFVVWPDHGVPEQAAPLLSFIRKIRDDVQPDDGPIVVHCSAGVGRTGTFIAIDLSLQSMEKDMKLDIYGLVSRMRRQRNLMVQTEAQYIFIHDALLEAINFGVTEIPAMSLTETYKKLKLKSEATGFTGLTEEYERLQKDASPPLLYCAGAREVNRAKNRNMDVLPMEKSRVILRRTPGVDGTDYINASFINDYGASNAFIATQAPLAVTMDDFWRMIWEYGSSTIVMLSTLDEEGQLRYWPAKKGASFSNYRVDLLSSQEYGTYSQRDFNLSSTGYDYTRTIRHFQLQVWPADTVPDVDVSLALLDLIKQVNAWQQTAPEGPIVVHCDYGVGRTAVYCALSSMVKRMKAEGVVDVLQTVRALRSQRPFMIQNQGQYEFLYTTLVEFVDTFDPYSNFKK